MLRRVCAVFFLVGAVFAVSGVIADVLGWWGSLAFLTNLFSGITGAMFGIPFALIILRRLASWQAEELQKRNVERLKTAAARELSTSVSALLQPDRNPSVPTEICGALDAADGAVKGAIAGARQILSAHFATGPRNSPPDIESSEVEELLRLIGEARTTLSHSLATLCKVLPSGTDVSETIADMSAKWRFLDEYVRPRVYELGGTWLDQPTFAYLQAALYKGAFDLSGLSYLRDVHIRQFETALGAVLARDSVLNYQTLNNDIWLSGDSLLGSINNCKSQVQSLLRLQEAADAMLEQLAPLGPPSSAATFVI